MHGVHSVHSLPWELTPRLTCKQGITFVCADLPGATVHTVHTLHRRKFTNFTSEASVKRCLALMHEECPKEEHNFYVAAESDD